VNLQRIHPGLWPLQLAGAVTVFTTFLCGIAITYALVAVHAVVSPEPRGF
jgi:hypothetical protein